MARRNGYEDPVITAIIVWMLARFSVDGTTRSVANHLFGVGN
jgi:hypothetical protein